MRFELIFPVLLALSALAYVLWLRVKRRQAIQEYVRRDDDGEEVFLYIPDLFRTASVVSADDVPKASLYRDDFTDSKTGRLICTLREADDD